VNPPNLKEQAHRLIDRLADHATWDGLMYENYVRQAIEAGLHDSEAERVSDADSVRKSFGLSP